MTILETVSEIVDKIREPLGLDRWQIQTVSEPLEDARACCIAQPEYLDVVIKIDPDKLQTGDDLQELVVHEVTHLRTWEIHTLAEELANALAESTPETHREPLRKLLLEKVRQAGERATTDVGHDYLRLLRRAGVLDSPPLEG
ncbi:MAG: hypothetical protein H0W74_14290 [Sphingosinicella sp.]|nr:hypothetical protein [Sphingosinicella sp.]